MRCFELWPIPRWQGLSLSPSLSRSRSQMAWTLDFSFDSATESFVLSEQKQTTATRTFSIQTLIKTFRCSSGQPDTLNILHLKRVQVVNCQTTRAVSLCCNWCLKRGLVEGHNKCCECNMSNPQLFRHLFQFCVFFGEHVAAIKWQVNDLLKPIQSAH